MGSRAGGKINHAVFMPWNREEVGVKYLIKMTLAVRKIEKNLPCVT